MNEMNPQDRQNNGNRGIILLLAGGILLLVVAGVVYFMRKNSTPKLKPKPPVIEEPVTQQIPLVISDKGKPLALQDRDAGGSEVLTEEPEKDSTKKKSNSSGGKSEKLGKIDAKMVNKFINARFGQVRNCYERRLKMNSMLAGQLDLNINLSSKGSVTGIGVNNDTVGDTAMLQCVKKVIRSWNFPKPDGGRVVIGKSFKFKKKL